MRRTGLEPQPEPELIDPPMEFLPLGGQLAFLLDHLCEPRFGVDGHVAATAGEVDPVVESPPARG